MVTLGRWSYGLFIWHLAALAMVFPVIGTFPFTGRMPTVLVLTLVFGFAIAAVSYALVESPAREALRRWEKRNEPAEAPSQVIDPRRTRSRLDHPMARGSALLSEMSMTTAVMLSGPPALIGRVDQGRRGVVGAAVLAEDLCQRLIARRVVFGVRGVEFARVDHPLHQAVILGQLQQLLFAAQVGAAVTQMGNEGAGSMPPKVCRSFESPSGPGCWAVRGRCR